MHAEIRENPLIMNPDSIQSQGGKKRAEILGPEGLSKHGTKAALARWSLPKASNEGELKLGDMILKCAVIEQESGPPLRVISQGEFMQATGLYYSGFIAKQRREQEGAAELPMFLAQSALKPFIEKHLTSLQFAPFSYRTLTNSAAKGIQATIIPKICKVWIDALHAGALNKRQSIIAKRMEVLYDGFAIVGITALVDEATGYQDVRDRKALQEILRLYIDGKRYEWTRTFPLVFFKEICRLKKWPWNDGKMPSVTGRYINDLVYDRLAPGVLKELDALNPSIDGRRRYTHHQFLTRDIGHPGLTQRLYELIGMARMSDSWETFKNAVYRTFPKNATPRNDAPDEEDETTPSLQSSPPQGLLAQGNA